MLLAGRDFPPDIRVEKESRALTAAGHSVSIICDRLGTRPREGSWEGCRVIRVPTPRGVRRKANSIRALLSFRDPHWMRALSALFVAEPVDVLHVHDLPLLGTALTVAKRHRIPVIADLHENYPAALRYYRHRAGYDLFGITSLLYRPSRWEGYERRSALAADHVLVVVEEARERLVLAGLPPEKIWVVENTEDLDHFLSIPVDRTVGDRFAGDFVLSYIGGFGGRHRGLPIAIEAMPAILEEIPNARLLLVGSGPIKPLLENLVQDRQLGRCVNFIDWQPFDRVPSFIAASAVCLVPHESNDHTEATSPHKLFQYMAMEKPVVVSTCRPLRRIVEETGAGLVFQAGDVDSLANAVIRLRDDELRRKLGAAGRRAVEREYNWRETSRTLVEVYGRISLQ